MPYVHCKHTLRITGVVCNHMRANAVCALQFLAQSGDSKVFFYSKQGCRFGRKMRYNLMKKISSLILVFFIFTSNTYLVQAVSNDKDYNVFIKYYKRNGILIEFAQIRDMKDERKQKEINYLLEREIFSHLTELYNFWGQIDDPSYRVKNILQVINSDISGDLEFVCSVGLANESILSVEYSVYGYSYGGAHPNTWGYAFNIDLINEKVITISDFMVVDDRLLQYDNGETTKAGGTAMPYYSNLLDAFSWRTESDILDALANNKEDWYLDSNGDIIIFFDIQNSYEKLKVYHKDVKNLIYPQYFSVLPS